MNGSLITTATRLTVGLAVLVAASGNAAIAPEENVIRSAGGFASARGESTQGSRLALEEVRVGAAEIVTKPKAQSSSRVASVSSTNIWIYDADTELFDDFDGDGYYTYLRVRFDADTNYSSVYVYAVIYISDDGLTWEELFVTDDFLIEGSTSFDEYEIETELVTGYPPGLYDVLIELYDADYGDFVDEFGPAESSAFGLLPLEDVDSDTPDVSVSITHEHGGGGAASWVLLVTLASACAIVRRGRYRARLQQAKTSTMM